MSTEANKEIVRRCMEEMWNKKNLHKIGDFFHSNAVNHYPRYIVQEEGIEGFRKLFVSMHSAFSEFRFVIQDIIAEGDIVVDRFTVSGKHTGNLWGMAPPTGKYAEWRGIGIFRLKERKIIEHWNEVDRLGLLQQLGVMHR